MKHIAVLEKRFSKDCGQTGSGAGGREPPGEPKKKNIIHGYFNSFTYELLFKVGFSI